MFNAICITVCLPLLLISNEVLKQVSAEEVTASTPVNPPEIFLERYSTLEPFKYHQLPDENAAPNLITKEDDDYILKGYQNVSLILLTCRASYPIYWVMKDVQPEDLTGMETNSEAVFSDDVGEGDWSKIQPKEFISYLELYNHARMTGLYECRSVETNYNATKSTYIFLPGLDEEAGMFLGAGGELEVGLNGLDEVVIPCKTTKKNVEVALYKEDTSGNWSPMKLKAEYNSKQGFIVEKNRFEEKKFPFKNETFGTASWNKQKSGDGVHCCSNGTESPHLYKANCANAPDCEMKKQAFMNLLPKMSPKTEGLSPVRKRKSCIYTHEYGLISPFIMQCKGNGIDISGQYATELDLSNIKRLNIVPSMSIDNMTYNVDTAVRVIVQKWTNQTINHKNYGPTFTDLDLSKTDSYAGEKFVIDCCGMSYFHAIGRLQRIVWKNGTTVMLSTPDKERYDPDRHPYGKDFCYTYYYDDEKEEYLMTADENMSHFECIVPRWNERKPSILKIQLDIKVPSEPVFTIPDAVVNVSYNDNQLGLLQLDCKFSAGAPPPKVIWTKDGYQINQTDIFWSEVTENTDPRKSLGSTLLFMRAVKEIEGEYECTAENWVGSAQKSFFVKVYPRSYLDYWIALVVFGGFFALIICCALRISTLEKQTAPKKVKPVTFAPVESSMPMHQKTT